jgi:hypothetical protein
VTDPIADAPRPGPRPVPGERRLAHPPSDRYRAAEPPAAVADPAASGARGLAFAVIAAILGAAAITVLGGVFAVSSGLLVAAGAAGWAVAVGLRIGAGRQLTSGRRRRLALGLALLAVTAGQLGLWLVARSEGGVLGPLDYLAEVFGPLVPLEFLAASVVAWLTAR